MYENIRRCVRVGEGLSDEFEGKAGVHLGSVLSPQLFIISLDALSQIDGKVPAFCLYKEMDDALDRGNYRGLKLMQAMKVIERIAYILVRQVMTIDWVPWEDLYADGIVIIAYSMEEYVHKLLTWKEGMERKRLSERGEDHNHDLCYRP